MSSHADNGSNESNVSQAFNVSFPVEPPIKIDVVPREFLYPFYLVMAVVSLIVLITTNFLIAILILGILAGICYVGYRKFNHENTVSQQRIEETFFVPFEDQLAQHGLKLYRTKIAYLWNYDSVFLFLGPLKIDKISLLNKWNSEAIIGVEENVSIKELIPK